MNYKNLEELLQLIKDIPDSGKRDRILQLCLNTAACSIDESVLLKLIGQDKGRKTGMRPNEYKTARIEGDFIIAVNSKRKNHKIEYKRIPITPMLKPYLKGVTELTFCRVETLRKKFNEILPGHKLYDLRTTFYTRC